MRAKRVMMGLMLAAGVLAVSGCALGTPVAATNVTDISATLNADIGSNQSGAALYWFRYGTTTDYGTTTPDRTLTFPAGHTSNDPRVPVSEPLSGLAPDTTYHYEVCTSPGAQPGSRGCSPQDKTFTTGPAGGVSGIAFTSFRDSGTGGGWEIYHMDADGGNQTRITNTPTFEVEPVWSPDGRKLLYYKGPSGNVHLYSANADGSNEQRLTSAAGDDYEAKWSPDGAKVAFRSDRDGNPEIYVMNADGSQQTRLTSDPQPDQNPDWSPDNRRIVWQRASTLKTMVSDGSDVQDAGAIGNFPAWSPDGRTIAFTGGQQLIGFLSLDTGQVTGFGGHDGVSANTVDWSPDGSKLTFEWYAGSPASQNVYAVNRDGTGMTNISQDPQGAIMPNWSARP